MVKPYEDHEIFGSRGFYRIFKRNRVQENAAACDEFVWHRDLKDRKVRVVYGNGWKFQYDECLPIDLHEGDQLKVKKGEYHRLILGDDDLVLKITEK